MSFANIKISVVAKAIIGILLIVAGVAVRPVMYIAAGYAFIVILLEKEPESIICILFSWLNASTIFKFTTGGTSVFTLLELIVIVKLFLLRRFVERRFFFLWVAYVIYLIVGMGSAYTDLIKSICIPLVIYLITRNLTYEGLRPVSFFYIVGVFANSIIGLLRTSIPNMTQYVSFKQQGYGYAAQSLILTDRFSGLWGDPNYYSIHLIVVIAIVSVLFSRKDINGIIFYGVYIAMTSFGAMTGSKSFVLMLVIVTFFTMVLLFKEKQYSHSLFFIIVISVGVTLLLSGYIDVFSKALYRMQNLTNSGLSTGRTEIWKSYFDLYFDDLRLMLFGSGLGKGFLLRVPHNAFIDIIVLYGLIGGFIAYSVLYKAFVIYRKSGMGNAVPALMLLIMYFFLSMYYSIDAPFQIALVSCFFFLKPETIRENEKLYV